MVLLEVLLFLLLCALALGWASRRFGLPYPIALVVGGGLLGFVPRLPQLDFDPQFLLVLVLPPILYQAALLTSWRDFKANLRTISLLAIGLVLATTLVVGTALKALIPGIPWAAAFVFGAIVSPPDAVAATAIPSRLHLPRRLRRAGGGRGRAAARTLLARHGVGRDAHPRALGLEHPGLHAEQPDLHPDRAAALGHRRAPAGLHRPGPGRVCAGDQHDRDPGALCLGIFRRVPAGMARAAVPSPGRAAAPGRCSHRALVRHARHRVARRRACAAGGDARGRRVPLPRPDHFPDLRGHRRHPRGAGPYARAPHRAPQAGLRSRRAGRAAQGAPVDGPRRARRDRAARRR